MNLLNLKNNKGITLITLAFTIVIIMLLSGMILYNVPDYVHSKKLKDMQNDIELIREKVMGYYARYNEIPGNVTYNWNGKDYIIIDLQSLEGLTLQYGNEGYNEYKNVRDKALNGTISNEEIQKLNLITDIFIVDTETLEVYYVKGVTFDGKTYHTYN